jgi:hypothetical protein
MEDYEQASEDKVKAKSKSGDERKHGGHIYLPPSKDSWRRVFNETLKCYEVYVRKSNVLVATGIGNTGDSFLIGALPAIMEIYEKLLKEIENGEVKEETFRGAKYILTKFRENVRKSEAVGKSNLLRLNTPEFDLGGQGGGNYTEAGLLSE